MEVINLCGKKGSCCPSLIENIENRTLTIIDGKQKIIFQEEEIENLRVYLNQRRKY